MHRSSAGVGRTGTFICVDHLLQHIQDYDGIDIFGMVLEMRQYRCNMVQTEVRRRFLLGPCSSVTARMWSQHRKSCQLSSIQTQPLYIYSQTTAQNLTWSILAHFSLTHDHQVVQSRTIYFAGSTAVPEQHITQCDICRLKMLSLCHSIRGCVVNSQTLKWVTTAGVHFVWRIYITM